MGTELRTALVAMSMVWIGCVNAPARGDPIWPSPLAVSTRTLGAGPSELEPGVWDFTRASGWSRRAGLSTIGLTVRLWGTVTAAYISPVTNASWFYIDDGFGAVSDFGDKGVIVYSNADVRPGDFVSVTGISSTEPSLDHSGKLVRIVRADGANAVQVPRSPQSPYPFSDEFNGPPLNPNWLIAQGVGELSLTREPGWLCLTQAPRINWNDKTQPWQLWQPIPANWDLDVKIRAEFAPSAHYATGVQEVGIPRGFASITFDTPLDSSYNDSQLILGGLLGQADSGGNITRKRVYVVGQYVGEASANTLWFRLRGRGDWMYGSVSHDGVTYSQDYSARLGYTRQIFIYARQVQDKPDVFARAYFDYFRLTVPAQ